MHVYMQTLLPFVSISIVALTKDRGTLTQKIKQIGFLDTQKV